MSGPVSGVPCFGSKVAPALNQRFMPILALSSNVPTNQGRSLVRASGSMGIGFTTDGEPSSFINNSNIVSPKYGLSVQQMHVLGLTPEGLTKVPEVAEVRGRFLDAVSLGKVRSCLFDTNCYNTYYRMI